MKLLRYLIMLLWVSLVYSQHTGLNENTSGAEMLVVDNRIYSDQVIVKFREHMIEISDGFEPADFSDIKPGYPKFKKLLKSVCETAGFTSKDILFYRAVSGCYPEQTMVYSSRRKRMVSVPDLSLAFILKFPIPVDVEKTVQELESLDVVEYAHPPVQTKNCSEPDDPEYESENQWYLEKVNAPDTWSITTGQSSIKIAVIDKRGVKKTHEDLESKYVDGDGASYETYDPEIPDYFHGTAVAGVAASTTNNEIGIACLGWLNSLMTYRYNPDNDPTRENLADDIKAAADDGAHIIVMSFFTTKDTVIESKYWYKSHSYTLVEEAVEYADAMGVVMVASTGNYAEEGRQLEEIPFHAWPVEYPNVIGVSASNEYDTYFGFNYSPPGIQLVDVAAPGKDILTTTYDSEDEDEYSEQTGTSFSAPLVAALASLILSIDADYTPEEVQSFISSTADTVDNSLIYGADGWNEKFGYGRINAYEAIISLYNYITFRNQFTDVSGYPGVIKVDDNTEDSPFSLYILDGESIEAEAISQTYIGINYTFDEWQDESTTNPRTFYPEEDETYTAYYTGKPVSLYYYDLHVEGDPGDYVTLVWDEHPNDSVTTYSIWRKVKHNGQMGSPSLLTTQNRGDTTYVDTDYRITEGYTDDICYYDVRAYYTPEQTYADEEWIDIFGEQSGPKRSEPVITQPFEFEIAAFPNPFNPETTIRYRLKERAIVTLTIIDMLGRKVATLAEGERSEGFHSIGWSGKDAAGNPMPSGVYFYQFVAVPESGVDIVRESGKLMLVK